MSIDDPNTPSGSDGKLVASELKTQATPEFGVIAEKAKEDLGTVTERAAADVQELGHQADAKVSEVKEKAKSFAAGQKDLAADQINGVAAAITKVADELDGSEQQTVARYARDLAAGLSSMGKTIEDRDVDDLMGLAQDFGRKQPVAFLGAAALAGFMASRFALASAHRREKTPASTSSSHDRANQSEGTSAYGNNHRDNRSGGQ